MGITKTIDPKSVSEQIEAAFPKGDWGIKIDDPQKFVDILRSNGLRSVFRKF